ncbi:MAG: hypothetical protein M3Q23_08030 [Actinomycetota bacterium]|nr:hypothetical protein [Actinomycetota bacterium]
MPALGTYVTFLIGPTVASPAPPALTEAIDSIEVTHSDEGRSGFQMTFQTARSGPADIVDDPLLATSLLEPFNRVILIATLGGVPRVLMDGVITHRQLAPAEDVGASSVTITGEDVSVMMDLEEKSAEHPAQDETIIANVIIASYAQYGLIPTVIPPLVVDPPIPIERVPVQQGTDLQYLNEMAQRYGYVFFVSPGPAPFTNIAYWGPSPRLSVPQRALTVNMGPDSNVESLSFQQDALGPTRVAGSVQDRNTNQSVTVQSVAVTRPPLAALPSWATQSNVRTVQFRQTGLNMAQALARAQGTADASSDTLVAEGELDATRYGDLLQARALVGLRGAGYQHDGFFYVKRVTHTIRRGEYRQRFTLTREGVGSTTPAVTP